MATDDAVVLDDVEWVATSTHPKVVQWRLLTREHLDVVRDLAQARNEEWQAERAWTAASRHLEATRERRVALEQRDADLKAAIAANVEGV